MDLLLVGTQVPLGLGGPAHTRDYSGRDPETLVPGNTSPPRIIFDGRWIKRALKCLHFGYRPMLMRSSGNG